MGKLVYDTDMTIDFDDRMLAHLQLVISTKLRRGEAFTLSWRDEPQMGNGRTTIWLHPSIPLVFKYFGGRMPAINREWIDQLALSANSTGGLRAIPEPGTAEHAGEMPAPVGSHG